MEASSFACGTHILNTSLHRGRKQRVCAAWQITVWQIIEQHYQASEDPVNPKAGLAEGFLRMPLSACFQLCALGRRLRLTRHYSPKIFAETMFWTYIQHFSSWLIVV